MRRVAGYNLPEALRITVGDEPAPRDVRGPCRPLVFPSVEALAEGFPAADLAVATFWPTAA